MHLTKVLILRGSAKQSLEGRTPVLQARRP